MQQAARCLFFFVQAGITGKGRVGCGNLEHPQSGLLASDTPLQSPRLKQTPTKPVCFVGVLGADSLRVSTEGIGHRNCSVELLFAHAHKLPSPLNRVDQP